MSTVYNFFKKIFVKEIKEEESVEYNYSEYYYKDLNECIKWHGKPISIQKKHNIDIEKDYIFEDYDIRYEFKYLIVYMKNDKIIKVFPK